MPIVSDIPGAWRKSPPLAASAAGTREHTARDAGSRLHPEGSSTPPAAPPAAKKSQTQRISLSAARPAEDGAGREGLKNETMRVQVDDIKKSETSKVAAPAPVRKIFGETIRIEQGATWTRGTNRATLEFLPGMAGARIGYALALSALLVSTSKQMPLIVNELHRRGLQIPVLVGGAAMESCEGAADFAEALVAITGWSVRWNGSAPSRLSLVTPASSWTTRPSSPSSAFSRVTW